MPTKKKASKKPAPKPSAKRAPAPKPAPRPAPTARTNTSPLADFCRSLPGTTEDIKWGDDLIFSVGGKMYAGFDLEDTGRCGFKCDDADFDRLTDIDGGGVIPAPYAARFGWVSITRRGVLPDATLRALLQKSHTLVAAKLPARTRRALGLPPL